MSRVDLESLCQSQNSFVSDKDLTCDNQLLTCLLLNVFNCFPCFGSSYSCFLLDAPILPIAGLANSV